MSRNETILSRKHKIGTVFGSLKVVGYEKVGERTLYRVRCYCGTEKLKRDFSERNKSCGCLTRQLISISRTTHGMSDTSTWNAWHFMWERCRNPERRDWKRYGGRGIRVCDRWVNFREFYEDMGERPPGHVLDRIDNSGDYKPSNCRWATPKQSANNRSSNTVIEAFGEKRTLQEWSDLWRIPRDTIGKRLNSGWPAGEAVRMPLRWMRNNRTGAPRMAHER